MYLKPGVIKIVAFVFLIIGTQFTFLKEIKYQTGDIIFLSNTNAPDKLLQSITKSKYSHLGLVVKEKGKTSVFFAGSAVKKVSLPEFLALSSNGKYEVLRFKDSLMISGLNELILEESKKLVGSVYDYKYSWLDKEIYNTELIWKVFKRASNIELCALKPLSSIDIKDSLIIKKIKGIYGYTIPPTIKIVSPTDLHDSEYLIKIK